MRILAGDIGGTNTRLSLWDRDDATRSLHEVGEQSKFKNASFRSLEAVLAEYLPRVGGAEAITDACFGIAGPVAGRTVRLTNIAHWPLITADDVARQLQVDEPRRVNLINDMAAHGSSLAHIEACFAEHVVTIQPGEPRPTGMRAIVAPGTGLGLGMLSYDARGDLHRPLPSEGGHADLPAREDATATLIASLRRLYSDTIITREHVVSGPGLRAIYACLKNPDAPSLEGAPKAEDLLALSTSDPVARATLETFVRLLGELCANFAFSTLAVGGVYVTGGIANTLGSMLASRTFLDAFNTSGPPSMRGLITSIPVKLVKYQETGLLGAAIYATWARENKV